MPRRPSTPDHSTGREIEPVSVRSNRVSSNKIWVLNDQRLARQIGQSKPKIRKVSTSETARVSPMVSAIDRKHCPPSIGTPVRFSGRNASSIHELSLDKGDAYGCNLLQAAGARDNGSCRRYQKSREGRTLKGAGARILGLGRGP